MKNIDSCFSSVTHVEKARSNPYLLYVEPVSKNNPGGLKHRKVHAKQLIHYAKSENPRCVVSWRCKSSTTVHIDLCKVKQDAFYVSHTPIQGRHHCWNRLLPWTENCEKHHTSETLANKVNAIWNRLSSDLHSGEQFKHKGNKVVLRANGLSQSDVLTLERLFSHCELIVEIQLTVGMTHTM